MNTYTKLVRDKIPEIIKADGRECDIEIASKEGIVLRSVK